MSKRARTVATILLFVAVVLLIVTAFVSDAYPDLGGVLFAIGLLTLLGALTSHVLGRYWAKGDLEDDARVTVLPFLRLIAQDVDPGAKVDIWLPLVSAVDQKRLMRKKKLKPSRGKLVQTTFTAATGRVSVPLVDGTTIDLAIDRRYFRFAHSYWTRGRSGKLKRKTKVKWKVLVQIRTAVTPPESKLEWDERAQPVVTGSAKTKLKEKTKGSRHIRAMVRTYKAKSVGKRPAFAVDGEEVLGMAMQLCATLKAA